MPTEREVREFLERGERVLAEARTLAEKILAGQPVPEGTSEAVAILANLELSGNLRRAA